MIHLPCINVGIKNFALLVFVSGSRFMENATITNRTVPYSVHWKSCMLQALHVCLQILWHLNLVFCRVSDEDSTAVSSSFFHVGWNSADCTVNLINDGVNVQDVASVHFTGTGAASFYTCQVDCQPRRQCFLVYVNYLN